jgi:flagella basal body P-ring formation protein FlgA
MSDRLLTLAIFIVMLAVAGATNLAGAETSETMVRLRTNIAVEGIEITLGDLFEGAGKAAEAAFAAAPAPGEKQLFRVVDVYNAARAAGLTWEPDPGTRSVNVTRAGKLVPHREIVDRIAHAVSEYTGERDISVQLANPSLTLAVARNASPTVRVDDLDYDARSQQFTATLAVPADDPRAMRVQVQGRAVRISRVPVLKTRLGPEQVIGRADIEWIDVPAERIDRSTVTDVNELIGKAAKRTLVVGAQIRTSDVERPVLVAKGALITMTVAAPNMTLTATGRAIDEGGQGDLIQVQNIQSHKTVVATVIGINRVVVGAPVQLGSR